MVYGLSLSELNNPTNYQVPDFYVSSSMNIPKRVITIISGETKTPDPLNEDYIRKQIRNILGDIPLENIPLFFNLFMSLVTRGVNEEIFAEEQPDLERIVLNITKVVISGNADHEACLVYDFIELTYKIGKKLKEKIMVNRTDIDPFYCYRARAEINFWGIDEITKCAKEKGEKNLPNTNEIRELTSYKPIKERLEQILQESEPFPKNIYEPVMN